MKPETIFVLTEDINPERKIRLRIKECSNKPGVSLGRQIHCNIFTDLQNRLYVKYAKKTNTVWVELDKNVVFRYQDKNIMNSYCNLMEFIDNNLEFKTPII